MGEREIKKIMDPEIQKQMGAMRVMRQQQQNCMAKVQALKQTQKRIELTQKEISTLPEDINCYASVGRCFVFKTRKAIDAQLTNMSEQIEKTESQKGVLEKKEKETKDTVEELKSTEEINHFFTLELYSAI